MTTRERDLESWRAWIGKEDTAGARVDFALMRRFRATFDLAPETDQPGDVAPPGIHWCLAPSLAPTAELGADGHPARGGFLPPVPLPRRMWAGGALEIGRPLRGGDEVHRVSRIEDVALKEGRTGPLCFVTVLHVYTVGAETVLRERQDIVYRDADRGGLAARGAGAVPGRPETDPTHSSGECWRRMVEPHPTLLFRYSALTFNGHRIHYDRRYCVEEEGYPGLVVHGPLQATTLLQFATDIGGEAMPKRFKFRSEAPLFDGAAFEIGAMRDGERLHLWTADAAGRRAMRAEAVW